MKYRVLGKTNIKVSEVSFGAWAIGGAWGSVKDEESLAALHKAIDLGVNFIDTADVYGDGRSENLVAQLQAERSETIHVATKAGRKLNPHVAEAYTIENIRAFVEQSLKNLKTDSIELLQLHCPPTAVYYNPRLFEGLDKMVVDGKLQNYGVSVEKVEEALKAIEYPGVSTVQIIFNMFRQRPMDLFFREARAKNVGVIVRVPLASGLLTGKMKADTPFEADDHRLFNRHGEAFDKGETFSGVPFETGLLAVEKIRALLPQGMTMAQFALKWILQFDAVSCVIPGAKRPEQARDNCGASDMGDLSRDTMEKIRNIYEEDVKCHVHHLW
ncbi:MAG: aldo/keto reductase [Spirochaetales bacterium]|nr:aldo/keto reductase [Spirochaetales bacterium]